MISNITSGNSFYDVAMYNQKKVNQQEASILYSQKLRGTKPETLQKAFENYNLSISTKPVIHVSLSFAREDEGQLTDEKMVALSQEYLQKMGYGKQPYIIYRHFDTPHPHVHILSTRVDIETQKRINDSFDYIRSKQITEKMEQTYGLTKADQQTSIKSKLVDHLQSAFQKDRPENITQLNQSLEKRNLPVRARETQKGLIYHGVREDGVRHSKYYRSSIYKEVGLDAPSLQAQFQQNIQAKQYLKTAIEQALPQEGKTSIGLFSKELQSKGILTDFRVKPDDTINISYQYKDHVYKDAVIKTNAQEQLVFPTPQDYHLREQLTRSIAANEPLELGYENGKVTVATPNPALEKELNKRSNGEILALSDIHKEYRSEYQQAGNSGIRNAVLALAATDIDDSLQEQINRERIDQREIRR